MLYLIGTGLTDYDISYSGVDICRKCELLYYESYTSNLIDKKVKILSDLFGKKIEKLERSDLEEKLISLVNKSIDKDVALLINGDPLIATTHKIVIIEAIKKGVKFKVIHSNSIFSAAIGESGLDFYRFGAICTLARWSEHYKPVSFYNTILNNYSKGLHSIILLDYDSNKNETIPLTDAISTLKEAENIYKGNLFNNKTKLIVINNLGSENGKIFYINLDSIKNLKGLNTLILPGNLSDIELEWIEKVYDNQK